MSLVSAMGAAGSQTRGLISSLHHVQGSSTKAAARLVPGIFRRETAADVFRLASEQFTTGLTLGAFTRDTEADRASLRMQIEQTAITQHLFTATGAQAQALAREQARTEQQLRPFRR